ncbi:hypothetical protein HPB47_026675 [Ixodes persulcatus]|uniref:Uncharacterized protein n=1 Tax=Ixodes persulcatus TaxID=34615 RepID=A0AC60PZ78_IXOPE|nr:hypothetical protein HPB47_026675 [Ixodes persulcatus]
MQPGLFKVDVESKMISLVEKRRFLWDVRDRSYHKRDLKERAYAEIAAALGRQFTAAAVKSRFANLRSQYHREQRRVTDSLKSASSPEDVYVPRWTHYTKLQFLQTSSPRQGRWPAPDNQDASEVYTGRISTLDILKQGIEAAFLLITDEMRAVVFAEYEARLRRCTWQLGGHVEVEP